MAAVVHHRGGPGPGWLATGLATVFGNAYLVVGTLFWSIACLLLALVPPRGHWVFYGARLWTRGWLAASGVRVSVEHEVPLDPRRPVVYMANHQSTYDIPVLLASLPSRTSMLAKRSLFRIPLFGWAMRAGGFIAIDRDDRGSARASFEAAVARLQRGVSTLMFPEGTRSLDGRLGPLERGGFLLALKSGLPIVPVGIEGSLAIQRKGSLAIRPGRVTLRYGRPIDVASY
ncbi:MAG: lysophospholipid acyltransferase family protein, partial [Thermoanaerobaculia bacterium]